MPAHETQRDTHYLKPGRRTGNGDFGISLANGLAPRTLLPNYSAPATMILFQQ